MTYKNTRQKDLVRNAKEQLEALKNEGSESDTVSKMIKVWEDFLAKNDCFLEDLKA